MRFDQRAIARQPEQARLGLPGCASAVTRADLDEAEAEREQRGDALGVLVEAGSEPERTGQLAAERVHAQDGITWRQDARDEGAHAGDRDQRAQERE